MKKVLLIVYILQNVVFATFHAEGDFCKSHESKDVSTITSRYVAEGGSEGGYFALGVDNNGFAEVSWSEKKVTVKLLIQYESMEAAKTPPKGVEYFGYKTLGFKKLKKPKVSFSLSDKGRASLEGYLETIADDFSINCISRRYEKTKAIFDSSMYLEIQYDNSIDAKKIIDKYVSFCGKDCKFRIYSGF